MKKVVLCSSYPMLIEGFRSLMETSGEFSPAVCLAGNELPQFAAGGACDIVVADAACGVTLDIVRALRVSAPEVAVILWVDMVSTEFISQAIALGTRGVLRKNAELESCLECLRHVAAGELWLDAELTHKLLRTRTIKISLRERQLMGLLAQGLKNKEIAYRLGITEGTVKVYISRLFVKVGANDRFELALLALKNLAMDQTSAAETIPSGTLPNGNFMMPPSVSFEPAPGWAHQ